MLSRMLMRKSEPQPVLRKTDKGGRKRARKYRRTSLYLKVSSDAWRR
jgi:hypothetical protein